LISKKWPESVPANHPKKITKEAGAHLGFFRYLLNVAGLGASPGWFVG
jgi:hypothetical protein